MIGFQSNCISFTWKNPSHERNGSSGKLYQTYNKVALLFVIVLLALVGCRPAQSMVLSYAVITDPDPLRASPGDEYDHNLASLTVLITNDTEDPVLVRKIDFRLLHGESARDLTSNTSGVNLFISNANDWKFEPNNFLFEITPHSFEEGQTLEPGEGLYIILSEIAINYQPGVSHLEIVEETGKVNKRTQTIPLAKFPYDLYVSDLRANPPVVEMGGCTTLSWEGTAGATYRLIDGLTTNKVANIGNKEFCPKLTTTFYLTATLVGDEDQLPIMRERTVIVITP